MRYSIQLPWPPLVSRHTSDAAGCVQPSDCSAAMPEVPNLHETGLSDCEVVGWYGLYGPADLPQALPDQLQAAVHQALADGKLRATWQELGREIWHGSAQDLAKRQASDYAIWSNVTRSIVFD